MFRNFLFLGDFHYLDRCIMFCRYITILPSMHLSLTLSPEEAILMRHPNDEPANLPDEEESTEPHDTVKDKEEEPQRPSVVPHKGQLSPPSHI